MFKLKYTISILDSKWQPIKRNLKLSIIPRINEYIFLNDQYHKVINVVHTFNKTQDVFLIIEEIVQEISVDNQQVTE
jgi:hypothetical protein